MGLSARVWGGWARGEEGETIPEMSCYSLQSALFGLEDDADRRSISAAGDAALDLQGWRRCWTTPAKREKPGVCTDARIPLNVSKGVLYFSPPCATITKAPVENLRKQKTTQIAPDNVLGVWPGQGEGGDPIKTHQPGLFKRKQGTAVKNKDSERPTDSNVFRNCSFHLVLQ